MMIRRALLTVLPFACLLAACGVDDDSSRPSSGGCTPDEVQACDPGTGCAGERACTADGSGFGPCECASGAAGGSGGDVASSAGGSGAGPSTGGGGATSGGASGAGASPGSGGGTVDTGSTWSGSCTLGACDPALQVGCSADQKCTVVVDEATTFVTACCTPGTVEVGEPCAAGDPPLRSDTCLPGAMCGGVTGSGSVETCHSFCSVPGTQCADCFVLASSGLPMFSKLPLTLGLCP